MAAPPALAVPLAPPAPNVSPAAGATQPAGPVELGAPWAPPAEWTGPGIPPKQYSLFDVPAGSPVLGYAAFDRDACEAELRRRDISFDRAKSTAGVLAPIRLRGALHGVAAHSRVSRAHRARSEKELIDCRLALSLNDFAAALAVRDIVELEWSSAYRTKGELGCTEKYRGQQHCAALAVDVTSFRKRDGSRLVVARDFHGKLGTLTCGAGAPVRNELWSIACDAAGREFQVVLTPNWNAEHRDHFHLELTVYDWVLVR
ncbi:MAG TPA: extensin family protein [Kofleriaceae bacterium]|nr:extensin family protein [Kofleriaceae bacterium]